MKKALLIPYRDFVCDKSYRTANRINTNTYLLHLTSLQPTAQGISAVVRSSRQFALGFAQAQKPLLRSSGFSCHSANVLKSSEYLSRSKLIARSSVSCSRKLSSHNETKDRNAWALSF